MILRILTKKDWRKIYVYKKESCSWLSPTLKSTRDVPSYLRIKVTWAQDAHVDVGIVLVLPKVIVEMTFVL